MLHSLLPNRGGFYMTDGPTNPLPGVPASLVDRVKNILVSPKAEWERIDAEPATVAGIFTGYVLILAAIGPIAMVIGQQVFGIGYWKPGIGYSVGMAVFTHLSSVIGIYILSLVTYETRP